MTKTAIGQDSHRFDFKNREKKLILAGIIFENFPPTKANSDGDVVFHSITNAISGITGKNIIGEISDKMCQKGITDSSKYLGIALNDLEKMNYAISHISISIEAKLPYFSPYIGVMKTSIATLIKIKKENIGITATTGEGLTDFGRGLGIQVLTILTASSEKEDKIK